MGVYDMYGREEAGIASSLYYGLALCGRQRLHDDLPFIPIDDRRRRQCEKHSFPTRKDLRTMRNFPGLDRHKEFGLATVWVWGDPEYPFASLSEHNSILSPTHAV